VLNYAAVVDDSDDRLKSLNTDSVTVAADGTISIPVARTVAVAGKSTDEIAKLIEQRLSAYVRQPAVTVRLLQQSQLIFLTGATIGTLPYLPGETLSSALGQLREQFEKDLGTLTPIDKNGGTLSRSAIDMRAIVIERDKNREAPVDGETLLQSGLPGPTLAPGDTLLFASKPVRVDVRGEVTAPGSIFLYPGDSLEQALLLAGGPLGGASTVDSGLIRDGSETPLPLGSAALRQPALNGDVIVVRAAPHVTVLGQVPNPGEYALKNGSTLLSALYVAGGPTKWANVRDIQVVHAGARQTYDLRDLTHGDLSSNVPLVDGDVVFVPEGHRIDASLFFQALGAALGGIYDGSHL
jgi:protein involved in polysaccharide export with SLBB domain